MITVKCPSCQTELNCEDFFAGQTVQCSVCRNNISIPAVASAPGAMPVASVPNAAPMGTAPNAAPAGGEFSAIANQRFSKVGATLKNIPSAKGGASTALCILSLLLGIAGITFGLLAYFGNEKLTPDFYKDPEKTAMALFKKEITAIKMLDHEKAYFWEKFGNDAISDARTEVLEEKDGDGDWALVTLKTKANGKTIAKAYKLKKNDDGYYILGADGWHDAEEDFRKDAEKEITKMSKDDESRDIKYHNIN